MDELERKHRSTPPARTWKRAPAAEGLEDLVDVTDEFEDLAPEDRVYRSGAGYLVKVKCVIDPGRHGAESIHVTGSIVGRDGKTLRRADGELCIHDEGTGHTHKSDAVHNVDVALEISRRLEARRTINAEVHYQLLRTGAGAVVTREAQQARRAAEAEAAAKAEG